MSQQETPEVLGPGRFRCASSQAMRALGEALGRALEPGDVVFLTGDLGAGKTCFTGGVAAGLGDAGPVTSPTFQIMCVHDAGRMPLFHFDLYRLESADQLEDVGVFEALEDDGACLIEWAEMFAEELGDEHLEVRITREPVGEWVLLDARTAIAEGGAGLATSVLSDRGGASAHSSITKSSTGAGAATGADDLRASTS